MLNSFPVCAAVGCVLGFLAGLGVGGGSLLMLWLTVVLGTSHPQARLINLLFFLPTALVSSLFRMKQGKLSFGKILPAILSACTLGFAGTWLSHKLPVELLQQLFGILLIFTGIRELFYRPRKAR